MVDSSEDSDLKIVDFGLSKIIGPNETSNDPFGTLVIIFIYLFIVLCGTRSSVVKTLWKRSRSVVIRCSNVFITWESITFR